MNQHKIAILTFGEPGSTRNALTEEKYSQLANYLIEKGNQVASVLYHDSRAEIVEKELAAFNVILVWVNPVEKGFTRQLLDSMLGRLSQQGCFVSAHPDTILRIGTKEILFKIKDTAFGGDTKLYRSFPEFKEQFLQSHKQMGIRILKPYRGNGGNGVFKIDASEIGANTVRLTHADRENQEIQITRDEFFSKFEAYFSDNSMLVDQQWNPHLVNGMVRCYLCGNKVAGFGYQEINALYPSKKPGKRFYFTEDCGLFQDLRSIMENSWVDKILDLSGTKKEMLPVIWDADFFINSINSNEPGEKYSLCEINASSVSPFPESAIPYIAKEIEKRVN